MDINEKIAKWIGKHWHEYEHVGGVIQLDTEMSLGEAVSMATTSFYRCTGCGDEVWPNAQKSNPDYERDPAACLELIEAVRAKGGVLEIQSDTPDERNGWRVTLVAPGDNWSDGRETYADTIPAAVAEAVNKLIDQQA